MLALLVNGVIRGIKEFHAASELSLLVTNLPWHPVEWQKLSLWPISIQPNLLLGLFVN